MGSPGPQTWSTEDEARYAELLRAQYEVEGLAGFIDRVNPRYPVKPHLHPLIRLIERTRTEQVFACVSMPPRHRKTTTLLNGLAWRMLLDPGVSHAYVTFNDRKTIRESRLCRRISEAAGVPLDPKRRSLNAWATTYQGIARWTSLDSGFTGEGVNGVIVIDDPIKGRKEAKSPTRLEDIWEWFTDVAMTRREPGASVIIVMCMTGDTPVLMGDGTERPLRAIRPGDTVATFDGGSVATSKVINWANQGPDSVYRIRMKSGRTVRANARHPFLVIENGSQVWQRTDQLKPGSVIQAVTGAGGAVSPVSPPGATKPSFAKDSAPTTTASSGEPPGSIEAPPTSDGPAASGTGTASPSTNTTPWSQGKAAGAPSATSIHPAATREPTGTASCASTTITKPGGSEGCSATTATSSSATASPPLSSVPPLTTWRTEPDEVVEVTPCGVEDVYDLQIDRTENFIANGLVSHNTRWAENDLAGRILKGEHNESLRSAGLKEVHFEEIKMQAICTSPKTDIMGRKEGECLWPEQYGIDYFALARALNPWSFEALYQQEPRPKEGRLFDEPGRFELSKFLETGIEGYRIGIGVDPAASGKRRADHWAAVVLAVKGWGPSMRGYVLDVLRFRSDPIEGASKLADFARNWGDLELVIEGGVVGKSPIASLRRQYPHLRIVEAVADTDKYSRAQPAAGAWNNGSAKESKVGPRLLVPTDAPWAPALVRECKDFTGVDGREDDQVDALSHIWNAMVDVPEPTLPSDWGAHVPVP